MKDCTKTVGWKEAKQKSIEYSKTQKRTRISVYDETPSLCTKCGTALPYEKRKNKFCSHACSASYNNVGICRNGTENVSKNCVQCGELFTRKNGGSLYCGRECFIESKKQDSINKLLMGEVGELNKNHRKYIINTRGFACEECGRNPINPYTNRSTLNVDHIDGRANNNRMDNLRVLCPTCHSLTPTYGALNKGNSTRFKRYNKGDAYAV